MTWQNTKHTHKHIHIPVALLHAKSKLSEIDEIVFFSLELENSSNKFGQIDEIFQNENYISLIK